MAIEVQHALSNLSAASLLGSSIDHRTFGANKNITPF